MGDADLLIPHDKTDAALRLMAEWGWKQTVPLNLVSDDTRSPFHGMGFIHPQKSGGCDLHWHVMHLHLAPHYDVPLWAEAVPITVGAAQTRALCAEHHLLHLFSTGLINENGTNWRWLPDALTILRKERLIDWPRLVAQCKLLELTGPVARILAYLHQVWETDVPQAVIRELARTPVSYRMQRALDSINTPRAARKGSQVFWLLYTQYVLSNPQANRAFPLGFFQFLRYRWSLEGGLGRTLKYALLRTRGVSARQAKEMA
jgi:hypothetical protein